MNLYTTQKGDTWDAISFKAYGKEKHMKELINANIELAEVLVFDSGTVIKVPDIESISVPDLPFWHNSDSYIWAEEENDG